MDSVYLTWKNAASSVYDGSPKALRKKVLRVVNVRPELAPRRLHGRVHRGDLERLLEAIAEARPERRIAKGLGEIAIGAKVGAKASREVER